MTRRATNYANVVRGSTITLELNIYLPPLTTGVFSGTLRRVFSEANVAGDSVITANSMKVYYIGYNYPCVTPSQFSFTALTQTATGTLDAGVVQTSSAINNVGNPGYNVTSKTTIENTDNLVRNKLLLGHYKFAILIVKYTK